MNVALSPAVRFQTVGGAWDYAREIIALSDPEIDEEGRHYKAVPNLLMTVARPLEARIPWGYPWKEAVLQGYGHQLCYGEDTGHDYTYGGLLREPVDQIGLSIARLRRSPDTRRATMSLWSPALSRSSAEAGFNPDHLPCMVLIQPRLERSLGGRRLNLTAVFRSHDIERAYPANIYALGELLIMMSSALGAHPGEITTLSINAHVYDEGAAHE